MNRAIRIALNIVGPPLIASFLLIATAFIAIPFSGSTSPGELSRAASFIPLVLFFAYILAGIPSLIHALLMEWLYRNYPPHTWNACVLSGASGAFSGILIDVIFVATAHRTRLDGWLLFYPAFGLIVGLLLGASIKRLSKNADTMTTTHSLRGCE